MGPINVSQSWALVISGWGMGSGLGSGSGMARVWPQCKQNLASSGTSCEQAGHDFIEGGYSIPLTPTQAGRIDIHRSMGAQGIIRNPGLGMMNLQSGGHFPAQDVHRPDVSHQSPEAGNQKRSVRYSRRCRMKGRPEAQRCPGCPAHDLSSASNTPDKTARESSRTIVRR